MALFLREAQAAAGSLTLREVGGYQSSGESALKAAGQICVRFMSGFGSLAFRPAFLPFHFFDEYAGYFPCACTVELPILKFHVAEPDHGELFANKEFLSQLLLSGWAFFEIKSGG